MRLELRLTIWLAVLLGAAAALTLFALQRFESEGFAQRSSDTAQVLAQVTENSLQVSMLDNAPEDIRRTIHSLEEGDVIDSVTVYRRNATAWVSSSDQPALQPAARDALLASMNTNDVVQSKSEDALSVFVPVQKQPECVGCHDEESDVLGAVEVRMAQAPFNEQFTKSAKASLFLAAIPLLIGLALAIWALRRTLLQPLAQVADASQQLAEGDLSVRLPEFQGWELNEVSTTFNEMAGRLETQAEGLQGSVEQLRSDLEGMEEIQTLLASGAGLGEVLTRSAGNLGTALEATGVGIWRAGADVPEAEWGAQLPSAETVRLAEDDGVITSVGQLDGLPEDHEVAWVVAPVRRGERTLGVVGVVWDPPRPIDQTRRDLLTSFTGLVGIGIENADLLKSLAEKEASLQGLLRKTLTVQEEERRRIARELHDETSQVLSALMMNIDLLESQQAGKTSGVEFSQARIEAVKALAEEAATNLDRMMLDLRPALLDELGLIPALRWYVAQASDLWEVPIEFQGERVERLPEHVEVAAFRIVQEAVSNVVRHAKASHASVRLWIRHEALHIEVVDDGVGFDVVEASARARTGEAVGLMGMRERAEIAGGSFEVESSAGAGTKVKAHVPLPQPANEVPEPASVSEPPVPPEQPEAASEGVETP